MPLTNHPVTRYNNILLIKPGAIGDLIQMTPVIRALHDAYPDASITLMVSNRLTASLFSFHPLVRKTIIYDRKGAHRSPGAFLRLWRELKRGGYDLVLNFQRSNFKVWLLIAATVPSRVLVYHKAKTRGIHAVANHLATLDTLGISAKDVALEFYPGPEAERYAEKQFSDNGFSGRTVIALNPGASHRVNRWQTRSFAALADLAARRLDAGIILVGGPEDVPLAEEIAAMTSCSPLVLTGKVDLLQLGAVLQRCTLLVSGDTGPMHIAAAVATPVVALFGAADPARTGPVGDGHRVVRATGLPCVPCRSRRCDNAVYRECMERITPEQVFDVIVDILAEGGHECGS